MSGDGRRAWLKFAALIALLVAAFVTVNFTGVSDLLDYDQMQVLLARLGPWGPLSYILLYAVLTVLTVPGTLLTVLGAAVFPLGWAYLWVLVGATLGASLSFVIARALGREAVERALERAEGGIGQKVRSWTERVEKNGVLAIAYLRLAYVPFPVLNYAAPLTGVRFSEFVIGTFLGILPGAFVFVFMGNTVRAAWETGSLAGIEPWQGIASVALFAASLAGPVLVQRRLAGRENHE